MLDIEHELQRMQSGIEHARQGGPNDRILGDFGKVVRVAALAVNTLKLIETTDAGEFAVWARNARRRIARILGNPAPTNPAGAGRT